MVFSFSLKTIRTKKLKYKDFMWEKIPLKYELQFFLYNNSNENFFIKGDFNETVFTFILGHWKFRYRSPKTDRSISSDLYAPFWSKYLYLSFQRAFEDYAHKSVFLSHTLSCRSPYKFWSKRSPALLLSCY